jgi:glycosyltransferase involved in cell wall biosynthesis
VQPWRDALGLLELVRICRRLRPQIVHANSSKAGLLALAAASLAGVPVRVFTAHGWAFRWHSGPAAKLYLACERLTGRLATRVICVSETELRIGLAAGTCTARKSAVIRNAVDVHGFTQAEHANAVPRLVSVTRLAAPKDAATLLRALARLNGAAYQARIVGDGHERQLVEAQLHSLHLRESVELLGERGDVPALLADSDVFVLSSRSEGLPVAVIEAMASGLPVVASNVGGVGELVNAETGILVRAGDEQALSAALATVLDDRALRARMGAAARARAEAYFDLPEFLEAHRTLYERELTERPSSSRSPFGRLSR